MASYIGAALLLDPTSFHAANGIQLGSDVNLLSEVRAPGGALLGFGLLTGAGAFVRRLTFASTLIGAAIYLGYGLSRLVAMGLDGMPSSALLGVTALELVVGTLCILALRRELTASTAS